MQEGLKRKRIGLAALAIAMVAMLAGSLAGCGGSDSSDAPKVAGCEQVDAPEPEEVSLDAPKQTVKPGEELTAVVKTSCGTFEIALNTEKAPETTNSFAYLAREGFYDGLDFNRVVSGFVVQGGDPLVGGDGGPGYTITEEPPADTAYTKGVVAMAKDLAAPSGQSGSQFFVVTSLDTGYPPEYALLGRVGKGFNVVTRIDELGTPDEKPKVPVLIESVTIAKG
ncbi:MAG TPA: peptidylprolyl isomerase [Solirubrobacterales bacterium]|jgi:cyclophilin family peptidyl-prolyl cis-trans isomerase